MIEVRLQSNYMLDNDHIYHIYNRGVEKRDIFLNNKDCLRFIVNLYEFNNTAPAINFGRNLDSQPIEVRLQSSRKEPLVDILAFCLMPNHYHLMLRQLLERGITEFMRKLGTGYTNYFNLKYNRVGPLFQGKFKSVILEREQHFQHLPHYIHLNPLDLLMPTWREGHIRDTKKAMDFLNKYRWSSLPDYLAIKNFPTITNREFLTECVGSPNDFKKRIIEWMNSMDFESIQTVTLDWDG